ncbi:TVP38/TMEM64 family protein [Roseateles sp. DB2]|uniref:TVP38/TMEM64 family protein n=1 Tax=Roseateles sp. DB2 TaxID=3453717 RepID=UPI003EE9D443
MNRPALETALGWRLALLIALLAGLMLLGWAWHQDSWQAWLRDGQALHWLRAQAAALGPLAVWLLMSGALCLALPLVLLSLLVIAAFGPWWGMALCFASAGLSGLISHRIGHCLGHALLLRLAGPRVRLLSEALGRRGLLAVVLMRLTPVAPFAVVNMVAGATHIRPWQMLLGTWVGMAPSTLVMGLFLDPLMRLLGRLDRPLAAAVLALVASAAALLAWWRRRGRAQD